MAYTFAGTVAPASLRARLNTRLDDARTRYAQWRTYRRTVHELSALTDRDLSDLGIGRSEIRRVAIEAAYGA